MEWTKYQLFLVVLLVVTGTFNTLSTKKSDTLPTSEFVATEWHQRWADRIDSKGADGVVKKFTHPFFQTVIMFLGEISCLLAFKLLYTYYRLKDNSHETRDLVRGNRNFSIWIFCLPASCDIIATSIMNIGLTMTYASSFQMLRGSVIIFVAFLSVAFIQRKITLREWIGIFFVISGLIVVGVSDFSSNTKSNVDANSVITGDLLILVAQVVTAAQIVLEEHFVSGKDIPPLQAVGLEGCFGFVILGLLLIPLYYIHIGKPISNSPDGRLEDLNDTFIQIKNNLILLLPILGNAISIAFFNFAGISVTKEISGTTRTVLDSVRTFFVWAITLALGWQAFFSLQIVGFFILLMGIFIYNDVMVSSFSKRIIELYQSTAAVRNKRGEILINQEPDDINP